MTIHVKDVGESVVCDAACGEDYTGKPDTGGLLLGSMAVCPKCAPRVEQIAKGNGIRARCPEGMPFAAWVLSLRGGDNRVITYTGEDATDLLRGRH